MGVATSLPPPRSAEHSRLCSASPSGGSGVQEVLAGTTGWAQTTSTHLSRRWSRCSRRTATQKTSLCLASLRAKCVSIVCLHIQLDTTSSHSRVAREQAWRAHARRAELHPRQLPLRHGRRAARARGRPPAELAARNAAPAVDTPRRRAQASCEGAGCDARSGSKAVSVAPLLARGELAARAAAAVVTGSAARQQHACRHLHHALVVAQQPAAAVWARPRPIWCTTEVSRR